MRRAGPSSCAAALSCWISLLTARSAACSARRGERRVGCTLGCVVRGEIAVGGGVFWIGLTLGNLAAGVWPGAVRGLAVVDAVSGNLGGGLVTLGKLQLEKSRWVDCSIVWFCSVVLTGPVPLHIQFVF